MHESVRSLRNRGAFRQPPGKLVASAFMRSVPAASDLPGADVLSPVTIASRRFISRVT
jgi:hypothetical protein